jgi:hypothetical protein
MVKSFVMMLWQMSTLDEVPCDDASSSSNSACVQRLIFSSESFSISIPSWGNMTKPRTIHLFPKPSADFLPEQPREDVSQKHLQSTNETFRGFVARQTSLHCSPLQWNKIPALFDHRAMTSAVDTFMVSV